MVTDSTIQTVDTCQGTVVSICSLWTFYTTQITLQMNACNQQTSTTINTQGIIVWCVIVLTWSQGPIKYNVSIKMNNIILTIIITTRTIIITQLS